MVDQVWLQNRHFHLVSAGFSSDSTTPNPSLERRGISMLFPLLAEGDEGILEKSLRTFLPNSAAPSVVRTGGA